MTTETDPVLLVSIIGSILIPICVFLHSKAKNSDKDRLVKQEKLEAQLVELEKTCTKMQSSLTRAHMRSDQLENDQKKLENAVEIRMDRFQDKLEKIYDMLVQGLQRGSQ